MSEPSETNTKIAVDDLNKWLMAQARTAEIIKRRFNNLSVNETNDIAREIVMVALTVLR